MPRTTAARVAAACGAIATLLGAAILCGWAFDVGALKSPSPQLVTTKANSAALAMLIGAGLLLAAVHRSAGTTRVIRVIVGVVLVVSLVTLAEYAFGIDARVDQVLFHDASRAVATSSPGRMSPVNAVGFLLASVALIGLSGPRAGVVQAAAAAMLAIALSTLLGYMYGSGLTPLPRTTGVSVYTAVLLAVLGAGLLAVRAREGPMRVLTGARAGSVAARRLAGVMLVVLPVAGLIRAVGERTGIYGPAFGVALMVVISLVILLPVVWLTAVRIDAADLKRTRAMERLKASERQLRRALEEVRGAEAAERARVAIDIHDDALPALTAVSLQLELIKDTSADAALAERVGRAEDELRAAASRLRHLVFDLRPDALEREGLATALRHRLERTRGNGGFEYTIRDRLGDQASREAKAVLYRIALEAINNIARHARASQVEIRLERRDDRAVVLIEDDGIGMASTEPSQDHLGLATMRKRARLAGGQLAVHSAPGGGTTIEFWTPRELETPPSGSVI